MMIAKEVIKKLRDVPEYADVMVDLYVTETDCYRGTIKDISIIKNKVIIVCDEDMRGD